MSTPDYRSKGDLTTGPVKKHLVRLTVPMIWGILAIVSFQLVDAWYTDFVTEDALAPVVG